MSKCFFPVQNQLQHNSGHSVECVLASLIEDAFYLLLLVRNKADGGGPLTPVAYIGGHLNTP